MAKPLLTVITPVYNEQEVISAFYERTKAVLRLCAEKYDNRILFVVDRGTDRTLDILQEISREDKFVQIVSLSARFGHQMSLLAGIDAAKYSDIIIMMDSDLQHPPELIPKLITLYEAGNDIVFTVRTDTEDAGAFRKYLGNGFYSLLSYFSNVPINKNSADFRLISRRVAKLLRTQIRERNLFLRGIFSWIGFNQSSVEYVATQRFAGSSKYSFPRMVRLATAGVLSFSTKPLLLSITFGVWLAVISFLVGCFTVADYFIDKAIPTGWTTIVTLLLFFSGIQLIFIGILGVYIGGIYEEVKGRPHYIIDQTTNIEP